MFITFYLSKIWSKFIREGALKLKELTYIHTEAFSAGEMKHGPFAMIESKEKDPIK